ncbi:MAG: tetratricopeptide repeat protein [Lautropia sp.]
MTEPAALRHSADYLWDKARVIVLLVLNRRAAALQVLDRMVGRWPADRYARVSRAHVAAQFGRAADAIADLRAVTAMTEPPPLASDWFNFGFLLDEAGDPAGAEAAFRAAVGLDPKLDRAWYGLGLVLIRQRRLDEAVAALQRNTELQPMSPYGWYQLARVQMDRHQPDEARRIIRHLKGFEPKVAAQLEREVGHA